MAELGRLAQQALAEQEANQAEHDRLKRIEQIRNGDREPEPPAEPEPPSEEKALSLRSARQRIQGRVNSEASDELFDSIIAEALGKTKAVRHEFFCKACNAVQIHYVRIPDIKTQIDAAEFLLNQGDGRPSEQKPETQALIVNRRVIYSSQEDEEEE